MIALITALTITTSSSSLFALPDEEVLQPDYCSEPEEENPGEDYTVCTIDPNDSEVPEVPSYLDTRDYREIYKLDGAWYGILDITTSDIEYLTITGQGGVNYVYIDFDRDTEQLVSIDLNYTTQETCKYMSTMFGCLFGTTNPPITDTLEIFNKTTDGSFVEVLSSGFNQTYDPIYAYTDSLTIDGEFDYTIEIRELEAIETVNIIEFTFILTEEAVTEVTEDIQAQYQKEIEAILHDTTLNITEKQLALIQLNIEYSEYELVYGEEITQLCIDDPECEIVNDDLDDPTEADIPPYLEDIMDNLLLGFGAIVAAIVGTSIVGVIAYIIVRKALETTGSIAWTTTKGGFKTGGWFGKRIALGILEIFKVIGRGALSVSKGFISLFIKNK